jgi:hypothetical protein
MSKHLKLAYDEPSDTLYLDWAEPHENQDSRSISKDVLARFSVESGKLETLEVMNFTARFTSDVPLDVPLEDSQGRLEGAGKDSGLEISRQEYELVKLVAAGLSPRKVSVELGLSEQSVKHLVSDFLGRWVATTGPDSPLD